MALLVKFSGSWCRGGLHTRPLTDRSHCLSPAEAGMKCLAPAMIIADNWLVPQVQPDQPVALASPL